MQGGGSSELPSGLAKPDPDRALLELVRDELASECKERLYSDARRACDEIDSLLLCALRQLPPHIRSMPAHEACRLEGAEAFMLKFGAALGSRGSAKQAGSEEAPMQGANRKRHDAATQTERCAKRRARPPGAAGARFSDLSMQSGLPPSSPGVVDTHTLIKLEEQLKYKAKVADELHQIMSSAPDRLVAMPADTRRSFMSRVEDTFDKMFICSMAESGGA